MPPVDDGTGRYHQLLHFRSPSVPNGDARFCFYLANDRPSISGFHDCDTVLPVVFTASRGSEPEGHHHGGLEEYAGMLVPIWPEIGACVGIREWDTANCRRNRVFSGLFLA